MLLHYPAKELLDDPELSRFQRVYVWLFGYPISGLRIRLRRVLPAIEGDFTSIIDLGCGKGAFTFELARRYPNAQVVGVDIDEHQISVNQEVAKRRKIINIRFEAKDILNLDYEGEFDLAVSVDNLEHIEDDVGAIRRFRKLLRPGGKLVCHVPALKRIWLFSELKQNFEVEGHVRPGYEMEELKRKLAEGGFTVRSLRPTYGYLETISNNISYLITGASKKNVLLYAVFFPFLNMLAWLGRHQDPKDKGAGLLTVATA